MTTTIPGVRTAAPAPAAPSGPSFLSPRQLAGQVRRIAASPREWMSRVRLSADGRWYERIHAGETYEVWLISWLPGQATGFHDHGGSAGFTEFSRGAVLVDIRPEAQRAREGGIPGAVIVERNILEWRFDPASDARLPWVDGYDQRVIVFCSEGYTSSLAAAALNELGLAGATDMTGGFLAWAAGGLPTCPPAPVARAC
jgi:rhodanese-related sulfurtransferase